MNRLCYPVAINIYFVCNKVYNYMMLYVLSGLWFASKDKADIHYIGHDIILTLL